MSEAAPNVEMLLRQALSPVEPPEGLAQRFESRLTNLTEIAAEELDSWELRSMRDPRNWVRPAAALVVGTGAGAALVILRARQHAHQRHARGPAGLHDAATRVWHDAGDEARRLLKRH